MAIYTVHQPPLRRNEASPDPERFVFVRDGFHVWGFILAPLWMAWHRLWLALVLYLSFTAIVEIALRLASAPALLRYAVAGLIALVVGMEGASLRRWALRRRGFRNVGVVVGDDLESAERRFFSAFVESAQPAKTSAPKSPLRMPADNTPDVLGLFPRPDSSR